MTLSPGLELADFAVCEEQPLGDQIEALVSKLFPFDSISIVPLLDGLTNKRKPRSLTLVFLCSTQGPVCKKLVVRVYGRGTESFICRRREIVIIQHLSSRRLFPGFYGSFKNGLVYGYVEGTSLSCDLLPAHSLAIARQLCGWHGAMEGLLTEEDTPCLWRMLWCFYDLVEEPVRSLMLPSRKQLEEYQRGLEPLLSGFEVAFCHNDLLSANVILHKDQKSVSFIDFEYAECNYLAFELANHFCEYAGPDCDYSKLPSAECQLSWLGEYAEVSGKGPDEVAGFKERLIEQIRQITPVVHLVWGCWALAQSTNSLIDWNYVGYAKKRLLAVGLKRLTNENLL